MEEKKKQTFTVVDAQGKSIECEVIFSFTSQETGKSYIVYTDRTRDAQGNLKVYANTFDPAVPNSPLQPIKSEKEWEAIHHILEEVSKTTQAQSEKNDSVKS